MADEVVRLGVDPTPAVQGYREYEAAAERAIQTTDRLSQAVDAYERGVRERLTSSDISAAAAEYDRRFGDVASTVEEVGATSTRATGGLSRLNFSLASLARQAAGVHPVVGQLANTVSTFAVGSLVTVGVLAGLAAIAGAIRLIGRESREAKERLEEARNALDQLAPDIETSAGLATVESAYNRNLARYQEIGALLNQLGTDHPMVRGLLGEREQLFDELMADAARIARGRAEVEANELERSLERVRALQEQIGFNMLGVEQRISDDLAGGIDTYDTPSLVNVLSRPPRIDVTSAAFQKRAEEEQLQLKEAQIRASRELQQLERDRLRANFALVHSLRSVGQAYGGVTEQILSLVSAALALERMPGFGADQQATTEDRVRGYGAAALSGIGYGVSTGNAGFGGLAGGVSGFALAGPTGAVVGAVSGIVSGLIEEGRRAREAARIWRNSLRDFRLMFDNLTALESNLTALDRAFEALSGGRSVEQVREEIEVLRNILTQYHDPTGAIQEQIERYEELLAIYEENAGQARELAEAEDELHRSRTQALNAPDGLRLSLLEWRASGVGAGGFDPGPLDGGGPNGPTYIDIGTITIISDDPETAGRDVIERLRRDSLRGGPDPLTTGTYR